VLCRAQYDWARRPSQAVSLVFHWFSKVNLGFPFHRSNIFFVGSPGNQPAGFNPAKHGEMRMGQKEHNQGQTDVSNGEYNRPVSHGEELMTWSPSAVREVTEKLSDYQAGRDHAKSQK
jgi:hypothetical protein